MLMAVGSLIAIVTLFDALYTTLGNRGAGPLTGLWTRVLWRAALSLRYRFGWKRFLSALAPLILIGIIVVWNVLFYLAYFLIFSSTGDALTHAKDRQVDELDTLYYIGSTFSTLGLGDLQPTGFPWTMFTSLGATVVTLLTTLSISYLIPVLSAVVERRALISSINAIGETSEKIFESAWTGADARAADSYIRSIADSLTQAAFKTHIYPVLRYYYFCDEQSSLSAAVLRLYDALLLQTISPKNDGHTPPVNLKILLNCVETYARQISDEKISAEYEEECGDDDFYALAQQCLGMEISEGTKLPGERAKVRQRLKYHVVLEGCGDAIRNNPPISAA